MTMTSAAPSASSRSSPAVARGRGVVGPDGTRPVRVMHVVYALQPGGMEYGVLKLVQRLDPGRVQSSICSTTPASAEMKGRVPADVQVYELRRRAGNDPALVGALYRLFRRTRPDIVHTHAWGTLVEGAIAARLAQVPCIVHGEHGTLQLRPHQTWIQRRVWGMASQVLSVSHALTDRMAAATGFPAHRIRTIQNGVDCERFSPPAREAGRRALGLDAETLAIGTAGRLVPVKDHANLIAALALLRDRGVRFVALLAGDGPLRADLERRIAEARLGSAVRLLGQHERIEELLAALDIFVLSSRSEGLSNTILEAMASGVSVVATDVGGARELVDDGVTGVLVPREAPAALSSGIEQLALDPARRRRMGNAARARAEACFSLARMVRDYEGVYLDLAEQGRLGRDAQPREPVRGAV